VQAEWLDTLPASDPRAQRSRRELVRVNALMANAGIVARTLAAAGRRPARLAEIGAGDGRFASRLVRALGPAPANARITLVDRQCGVDARARAMLDAAGWRVEEVRADVFDWLADPASACEAIVANLFLHHFEPPDLSRLLGLAARRAAGFVACEPRRSVIASGGARLLGLVGCGEVTRHDAVASVHAGFRGAELSQLWPREPGWLVAEGPRGLFSHAFSAQRA